MSPWLLLPDSAAGVSPAHSDFANLPLGTCRMLGLVSTVAVVILFVVLMMAFRTGPRTRDANESSEMEAGSAKKAEEGGMMSRKGSASLEVWRVE